MSGPNAASFGALRSLSLAEGERVSVAAEEVLKVRFPLSALQAASQLVEVVQLQEEGAVSEARAVVWGPTEADSKPMTEGAWRCG
eukprot:2249194-Pleurochrysis_carterae.AAC.3